MKIDHVALTLTLLFFAQQLIAVFKQNLTRYLIKTHFSENTIPLGKWYTIEFIQSLTFSRLLSLGIIAAFTLVTFPLGIWIASFSMADSFPMIRVIRGCLLLVTFPLNFYTMSKVLNEMPINRNTLLGGAVMWVSYALLAVGSYIMYQGANTQ